MHQPLSLSAVKNSTLTVVIYDLFRDYFLSPQVLSLISLGHSLCDIAHIVVNFSRGRSQNQVADRIPSLSYISVRPQHVNPLICNNNTRSSGVLNSESRYRARDLTLAKHIAKQHRHPHLPCLSVLSRYAADRPREMITTQYFDIRYLERFDK